MTAPAPNEALPSGKLRILVAEGGMGEVLQALNSIYADAANTVELTVVSTLSTLVSTARLTAPQVVFVDLALNPTDPMGAIRTLSREMPNVPLIALADSSDKPGAQLCLQEGATDYLLKGHAEVRVVERVLRGALERNTVNGLTDLLRDPLTVLYNPDGFSALARRAIQSAERSRGRLILLTASIENLDFLKNEFGPVSVDQAIRDVAALLKRSFRRTDVVARLGLADFAVLAPDALEPSAAVMRQRVQSHLAALNNSRAPWGEIALKLESTFWSAASQQPFPELTSLIDGLDPASAAKSAELAVSDPSRRAR